MDIRPSKSVLDFIGNLAENPIQDSESPICVTINVSRSDRSQAWIQLHRRTINFQHIDSQSADDVLGSILDELPVPDDASLEPGSYMVFGIEGFSADDLNRLLDLLIERYFEAHAISCSTEEL